MLYAFTGTTTVNITHLFTSTPKPYLMDFQSVTLGDIPDADFLMRFPGNA